MRKLLFAAAIMSATYAACTSSAFAAVAYDSPTSANLIWGSGNTNQGFAVATEGGVELALRAKVRYPAPNDSIPNGIKSQGNGVYGNFATSNAFSGRATWNFDWSINSNTSSTPGLSLDDLTYLLEIDYNPSGATNFLSFDPINDPDAYRNNIGATWADHSFGDNNTLASQGVEAGTSVTPIADPTATTNYATYISTLNLAQNSGNLAFFVGPQSFDPNVSGNYIIRLSAYRDAGMTDLITSTSIEVLVGNAVATPEAASIVVWSGLGALGLGLSYWRKKRTANA